MEFSEEVEKVKEKMKCTGKGDSLLFSILEKKRRDLFAQFFFYFTLSTQMGAQVCTENHNWGRECSAGREFKGVSQASICYSRALLSVTAVRTFTQQGSVWIKTWAGDKCVCEMLTCLSLKNHVGTNLIYTESWQSIPYMLFACSFGMHTLINTYMKNQKSSRKASEIT